MKLQNNKKIMQWLLAVLLFLVIFLILFSQVSDIFRKKHTQADMVRSLYYQEDNSIDVLALGSSHMYYGYSPNKVWGDTGISSFMLGDPAQTLPMAYYLLREALQFQNPKVILLDSYSFYYDEFANTDGHLRIALDNIKLFHGLKLNLNKIEAVNAAMPDASWQKKMTYLIPFSIYHARWNQLGEKDFKAESGAWMHGGKIEFRCEVSETPPEMEIQDVSLHPIELEYLDKIRSLCEEKGIELAFCFLPITSKDEEYYYEVECMDAALKKYLEEQDISYLDVMEDSQKQIDYATDFYDYVHLNYYGQVKSTETIETYLENHFQLEDHRQDPEYEVWNKQYSTYLKKVEKGMNGKDTEEVEGADA